MFEFSISPLTSHNVLFISHPYDHTKRVVFTVATTLTKTPDIFVELNKFIGFKDINFKVKLFELYESVKLLLDDGLLSSTLTEDLSLLTTRIFDLFDIDEIFDFITFKTDGIQISSGFQINFVDDRDSEKSLDQTYLRSDYQRLIALSIKLRSVLMIISTYINSIKADKGTLYKEYYAVELIKSSTLFTKPDDVITKLEKYIMVTSNGLQHESPFLILNGISSEFYLEWILSVVLIRRVCVGDISGQDPKLTLVTGIYSYVTQRLNPEAMGEFRSKKDVTSATGELDSKISVLESYKVKTDISIGALVELEVALSDYRANANRLAPGMDTRILEDALQSTINIKDAMVLEPLVTITRLLFSVIMPSKSIFYINRDLLIKCLAVTQAVLYNRGHIFLSNLVTSIADTSGEITITGIDSRARLDQKYAEELDKFFPFSRKESVRNKAKNKNLAVQQIEKLTEQIGSTSFITTCLPQYRYNKDVTNKLIIPSTIKNELARFVLDVVHMKAEKNKRG